MQIARAAHPEHADVVYLATGTNYPDALAAGAAAAAQDAPLLLTDPNTLSPDVAAEIESLHPTTIQIVGGTSAISTSVENDLGRMMPTTTVHRIAGADRFDTARQVVATAFGHASTAYLATGTDFPDALAAAAAAGAHDEPVVLVNGGADSVDSATQALLTTLGVRHVVIAGGEKAVSAGIASSLHGVTVDRTAGTSRYDTAAKLATSAFGSSTRAYIATGTTFPDALSGSALAASQGVPLLTSDPTCLSPETAAALRSLGVADVTLLGGPSAIADGVRTGTVCG